jgi:hypothetical protein
MIKKIVWSFVAVLVLAVVASLVFSYRSGVQEPDTTITHFIYTNNSVLSGAVTAISASSVTVTKQDGTSATLGITADTQVVSQVSAGQTGKSASAITPGTLVLVIPSPTDASVAQTITIVPSPTPPAISASMGPPANITGTVTAKGATSMTLRTQGGTATVFYSKDTPVFTNVLAGQKGKSLGDIKVGTMIQVSGTTGSTGVTAGSVRVLAALVQ